MPQTDQAIASLRSSIDALNAMVAGLQAQAAGKADASAVASLAIRVSSCEGRIAPLGSPVTAQGTAVSGLSNRIAGEASDADMALAQRVGSVQCGLAATVDAPHSGDDAPDVYVKPEKAVEQLRMGRVLFEGEPARQIRAAQEILRKAGMGQLEVVQRASELGSPFVVIDGQVFIPDAMVKSATLNPVEFKVRLEVDDKGQYYAAGLGVGVAESDSGKALEAGRVMEYISGLVKESALGSSLHEQVRQVIRDELKPGGMLHRSWRRIH